MVKRQTQIVITENELNELNEIAKKRYYANRGINNPPSGLPARYVPWQGDLVGCVGEYAASKALGVPWEGKFFEAHNFRLVKHQINDIEGFEVRASDHPNARLILQEKDLQEKPFMPFIFVHIERTARKELTATLVGWTTPNQGVREENYWEGHYGKGAYYVSRDKLNAMEKLN